MVYSRIKDKKLNTVYMNLGKPSYDKLSKVKSKQDFEKLLSLPAGIIFKSSYKNSMCLDFSVSQDLDRFSNILEDSRS